MHQGIITKYGSIFTTNGSYYRITVKLLEEDINESTTSTYRHF